MAVPQRPTTWPAEPAPHLVAQRQQAEVIAQPQTAFPVPPPPDPDGLPTDPASRHAVLLGWATTTLPLLLYNLADSFDWVHFTDAQFDAIKAIYGFFTFLVAYWVASNVYSKRTMAKIKAGLPEES